MLLHKDFAALARIDEMRQEEMERQTKPGNRNPAAKVREGLPRQITWHYKVEPYREVSIHETTCVAPGHERVPCKWCGREFPPRGLTLDGFCSAQCEEEWHERNARKKGVVK